MAPNFRTEFCYVFAKMIKICSNFYQRKIFEKAHTEISCNELLSYNKSESLVCNGDKTNATFIKDHPKVVDIMFNYAQGPILQNFFGP